MTKHDIHKKVNSVASIPKEVNFEMPDIKDGAAVNANYALPSRKRVLKPLAIPEKKSRNANPIELTSSGIVTRNNASGLIKPDSSLDGKQIIIMLTFSL